MLAVATPVSPDPRRRAAIVVQCLIDAGAAPPVASLPDAAQIRLTRALATLGPVDKDEVEDALMAFASALDRLGLPGPDGLAGAMALLAGQLSETAAARLTAAGPVSDDPWVRLAALPAPRLADLLGAESRDVAAIALGRLPVSVAADTLRAMPGERARRVAQAMSCTAAVAPDVVAEIGAALASGLDDAPTGAFTRPPEARLGAILNGVPGAARTALIDGLQTEDAAFADGVRRAIFLFEHLPDRLPAVEVPKALRLVDGPTVARALGAGLAAGGRAGAAADFVLAGLSQRMAATLREEIADIGPITPEEGEVAQVAFVAALLAAAEAGDVALQAPA